MPRPWHRSPVFWFGLPGLLFLVLAWIDSMSNLSTLDVTAFGRYMHLENRDSIFSATFYSGPQPFRPAKNWDLHIPPRQPDPGESWFPLPSYYATNHVGTRRWHYLDLSYWFLIMIYLGLWQLPWLSRYHRSRRIERALTANP